MSLKRIFLLSLILLSVSFAGPFSFGLSISAGLQDFTTDEHCLAVSSNMIDDDYYEVIIPTIEMKVSTLYRNTGLYISVDKPVANYYLRQYFILSGGLMQKIKLDDKSAINLSLGTTWHSVDAAIHSNCMFVIYTHIKSKPGVDIGLNYDYMISDKLSLFMGLNYNHNIHFMDIPEPITINESYTQTLSLNFGLTYTLS